MKLELLQIRGTSGEKVVAFPCERSLNGQEVLALSVVETDVSNC